MHKVFGSLLLFGALSSLMAGSAKGELRSEVEAPSALSQIVLNIASQQVVRQPLAGIAQVLLLDENLDLLTDYDLNADPITLNVSGGALTSSVIDDPVLFSGGVVDLGSLGIRYSGLSGAVTITASNSTLASSGVMVSFNGYDILEAVDLATDTVVTVYTDVSTVVRAIVRNGGGLTASEAPSLKAFFKSGGGSVKVFFEAGASGHTDTISVDLPTTGLDPGDDTLLLVSEGQYELESLALAAGDTLRIPTRILASTGISVVAGSVKPDSVYAGVPFDLSLAVLAAGLLEPFDSAVLSLPVLSDSDSVLTHVYHGTINHFSFSSDTLTYRDISAQVDSAAGLVAGGYRIRADFSLFIGGLALSATEPGYDSILILEPASLAYGPATLTPTIIASGEETYFQFEVQLGGSTSILLDPDNSYFELTGSGFSARADLIAEGDSLAPGVNQIQTELLYVPGGLLGTTLGVRASIAYYQRGAGNQARFDTDFGSEAIDVQALPLLRIIEVSIVAVNAPQVNTGQEFQVTCRIANLSTTDMDQFELQLMTDGSSEFDSILVIDGIAGEDTIEVYFEVLAADQSNAVEIFRVDIATIGVNHLLPLDNVAMATVQLPAELSVSLLLIGADEGYVDVGEGFDLLIGIVNTGESATTDGRFRINTNEVYLGLPDSALVIEEVIPVGTVRGISFVAPAFDTAITIDIELIERPFDLNTGLPALIGDTAFQINLAVTSMDVSLLVELSDVPSNLVVAGESKELFKLRLTNLGVSSISDIELESVSLHFSDAGGDPANVRSLLEVGSTALYDHGQKVTRSTAGGDRLNLLFDNFVVAAGDTAELTLRTKIRTEADSEFAVSLAVEDVIASFAFGPLAGRRIPIAGPEADGLVLKEVYTSVAGNLEGSFVVRNNPFDPLQEPAEFRYYLERPDQVRFLILTLTGEIVYEKVIAAEEPGGLAGENVLFWDGRSNKGFLVVNGVYVAVIDTGPGRQPATLKLAVMK